MRAGLGDVLPSDMWDDTNERGLVDNQHPAPLRAGHEEYGHMTASNNQGTVLVTGASSSIGPIYADRLARRGDRKSIQKHWLNKNRVRIGGLLWLTRSHH